MRFTRKEGCIISKNSNYLQKLIFYYTFFGRSLRYNEAPYYGGYQSLPYEEGAGNKALK